jgi:hypothetical protein
LQLLKSAILVQKQPWAMGVPCFSEKALLMDIEV